jgi:ribonuclease P protein component|tara:strand:- start:3434 stop:3775 length:342 start_codon:yes stop_codon:yes gene_type:complete
MKSKIVSLSKNRDYINLLKGKKISNKYFTIFFKEIISNSSKNLNVSFTTKKKMGNAVERNKIKRRLKNMMNDAVKKISLNFNYSYLVIAKNTVLSDKYEIIKNTLFSELEKIK